MVRSGFHKDYSGSHLETELKKSKTRARELGGCSV